MRVVGFDLFEVSLLSRSDNIDSVFIDIFARGQYPWEKLLALPLFEAKNGEISRVPPSPHTVCHPRL